jgi:mRNA interferase RelE/StbE
VNEPEDIAYLVVPTRSAEAELDRIPDKDWQRVQLDIEGLAKDPRPRNAIKIDDDIYRLRRGDWRIIYRIYDDQRYVLIGAARRRNERTYKGIERLFRAHG